jgi:hypothetical protein
MPACIRNNDYRQFVRMVEARMQRDKNFVPSWKYIQAKSYDTPDGRPRISLGHRMLVGDAAETLYYHASVEDDGDRLYSYFTTMPKEDRRRIRIDGQPTAEVDIPSSQPTIVIALGMSLGLEKALDLRHTVEIGEFYDRISSECGVDRSIAKSIVMNLMFSHYPEQWRKYLAKIHPDITVPDEGTLPDFMEVICSIRKATGERLVGKKWSGSFTRKCRKIEASVISKVIHENAGECLITVHDSVICKASIAKRIASSITKHFFDVTGIRITPRT